MRRRASEVALRAFEDAFLRFALVFACGRWCCRFGDRDLPLLDDFGVFALFW